MKLKPMLISAVVAMALSGCYGEGREPGDDPTRSDEGPDGGRPEVDPRQQAEPKDMGGGAPAPADVDDGRGTLDGSSDELQSPEPPPQPTR
jgi:hypothetical protein